MVGDRSKSIFGGLLLLILFGAVFYASWIYFAPKPPDAGLPGVASSAPLGGFGALAMSDDSGIYGTAWGFGDSATAERRSLDECAKSGGQNCIVKTSLASQCGALVTSGALRQSFIATDGDKFAAAAFSLAQCQATGAADCAVKAQFCSNGS